MWNPTEATTGLTDAAELLGDVRELAVQLGPPPQLGIAGLAPTWASVDSIPALRQLVERYTTETLSTREWPVILRAWEFTRSGKARELVALDREWGSTTRGATFAEASFRVGRRQLNKLRGLRHERVIARYLAAIETGEAFGWHPIVFGVVLAVYHVPLRSGLMQFATNTLAGLVSAAEREGRLPARDCQEVLDMAMSILPTQLPSLPPIKVCAVD
ncbi:MAG TPA: urease accessory UreF family protein [Verrucomicrobiota bacterium]|nr:hypothetical protein [Verrucomicrobiales bacterium]HRI11625.1 urease accessory UreF family protein [Verrucomicrobiota bacterium]